MRKPYLSVILIALALHLFAPVSKVYAEAPFCEPSGNCYYNGIIRKVSINQNGTMLVFFDTNFSSAEIQEAETLFPGGPLNRHGAIFSHNTNPAFAKFFYSTAVTAKAANLQVKLTMKERQGDWLKVFAIELTD